MIQKVQENFGVNSILLEAVFGNNTPAISAEEKNGGICRVEAVQTQRRIRASVL